ncbi:methyltransferase (TIGR00027 family) [Nocardia transvalensis]|uniref:Methyltransferase (TIGR00027 family) n=2 Tax=Nocardia transvalensis TaxID=37333 RepID=A0A7W9UFZ5_9NOCA|nr:class I SAM-dependent methyltransferase [Nocardia transvalensis]MBB5911642.1 methyltransferase (TIGR00027 family) [Nocardia transvalensis]
MTGTVDFTGVEWTTLVTLYLRAVESRDPRSILGDTAADEALRRIDYDFGTLKMRLTAGDRYIVVLRAKQLDDWAADFLARHPAGTVVQLGCGLDSRVHRLDPAETVRWFDVDLPDVIELRRRIYPERAGSGYKMIGSSVTAPEWLVQVPSDGPTLIIAEGLLMYLTEDAVRTLLNRLIGRVPGGELIFDGVAPWVVSVSGRMPGPYGGFRMGWALRDPEQLERWNPKLRMADHIDVLSRYAQVPSTGYRTLYRVLSRIPALRRSFRVLRYTF